MTREAFSPHTQQQDEREITRLQEDFSAGAFKDLPASKIPENGVAELVNMTNFGDYLQARSGSREWGDYSTYTPCATLPSFATGIVATSTVIGVDRTIEITSGYSYTSANVGDYFVHDDGVHERITEVTDSNTIVTYTDTTDAKSSSNAWMRAQINCTYFHKYKKKVLLLIGNKLYVSNDYTMTSWVPVSLVASSEYTFYNSVSKIDELNNYAFIFNTNGIYKINLDSSPYLVYPANSQRPDVLISDLLIGGYYIRRYTYTTTRLSGIGNRDRNTSGVIIELESGNVEADVNNKDFAKRMTVSPITNSNTTTVSYLNNPEDVNDNKSQHWTHYSVYVTLDVGINGIDPIIGEGNNSELFIWLADIPIAKTFMMAIAGTVGEAIEGSFTDDDNGAGLSVFNKHTQAFQSIAINSVEDSTHVILAVAPTGSVASGCSINHTTNRITGISGMPVSQSGTPIRMSATNLSNGLSDDVVYYATNIVANTSFQLASGYSASISGTSVVDILSSGDAIQYYTSGQYNYPAAIGCTSPTPSSIFTLTQNASGNVTIPTLYSGLFGSGYVGKTMFLSDGTYRHITGVSGSNISVAENTAEYAITIAKAGCVDATRRSFSDYTEDDTLRTRIAAWTLQNRFYEPLPKSDIGLIVPGFITVATRDNNYVYYSQLPEGYEYMGGYYNPGYQYAYFKGAIRALRELPNNLVVYCSSSTHTMPLNVLDERRVEELGLSVTVLAGQSTVDASIGLLDYGSLADIDIGRHIMITNEPAIRIFDGNRYSENIASQRMMEDLKSLHMATSAIYHAIIGYVFWGNNE